MRIKHYSGYGVVNATKISDRSFTNMYGEKRNEIVIRVKGNHERGICRDDVYDAFNWLLKKHFAKNLEDYRCIKGFDTRVFYEPLPNCVEVCDYRFVY